MMCSTQTMVMPFSRADALEHVGGLLHLGVVEAVEALVGEEEAGLRCERPREFELLQGRGAETVGRGVGIGRQADDGQGLLRLAPAGARDHLGVLAEPRRQRDVLEQRQVPERPRDLVGAPDALVADAIGGEAADLLAVELHAAGGRHIHAGDAVEGGALAGAVRADEPEDLTLSTSNETLLTAVKPPNFLVRPVTSSIATESRALREWARDVSGDRCGPPIERGTQRAKA